VRDLIRWDRNDLANGTVEIQDRVVAALQTGKDRRVEKAVTTFAWEHPHVRSSFGVRHRVDLDLDAGTRFNRFEDQGPKVFADVDHDGATRLGRCHRLDVLVVSARVVVLPVAAVVLVTVTVFVMER
jgi:hypothetical protein